MIPRTVTIHGHELSVLVAGDDVETDSPTERPCLLLIHGMAGSADTWRDVIGPLSERFLVIAPDLLGHGRSDKPRHDYSLGSFASMLRDLLTTLGVSRATVIGQSLGGGIALQFAYQYPERVDRLVLMSTGGVARECNPALRLVSMPGADSLLALVRVPSARLAGRVGGEVLRRLNLDVGYDIDDLLRVFDALPDATARSAIVRTLRAVVDWRGQVVSMLDRCYLAQGMPTMVVWGRHDTIVPVSHAHVLHAALPHSRLEIFEDSGHFPHHSEPARFVAAVREFIAATPPSSYDVDQWRRLLRRGRTAGVTEADGVLTSQALAGAHRTAT